MTDAATSFEVEPPSADEMARRIGSVMALAPWLICEDPDGDVVGYAYASRHHERGLPRRESKPISAGRSAEPYRSAAGAAGGQP